MKTTTLKALALSMLLTLGLAMPMAAQSDGFFRSNNDNYVNRDGEGLQNETFGVNGSGGLLVPTHINAPLGNGLLIMMAAGAGYALSRRRRTRKGVTLLLAAAVLLGMTQCKKNVDTISSVDADNVFITMNPANNSKYEITLGAGSAVVNYTKGDKIHVGCDGKYVGTLTHDGEYFSGSIANPKVGADLYFYFVSGLLDETKMSSSITSYNVNISDQSAQLPILSCGVSTKPYTKGETSYTSLLRNKVALAKFAVDETLQSEAITIFSNLSEATIDFANTDQPITPTGKKDRIKVYNPTGGTNAVRWGILLPQEYANGTKKLAKAGNTFCVYVIWAIPYGGIQANGFYSEGNVSSWSAIHGFTVSSDGNAVIVSSGNLQYNPSGNIWRVAQHPWDCIGSANANIASGYDGYIDLFGWGTWGDGGDPTNSSISSGTYNWTNDFNESVAIDGYDGWRTPTKDEWDYMLNGRTVANGKRYIKTTCHDVLGLLVFPDDFNIVLWKIQQAFDTAPIEVYNRQDIVYTYEYSGLTHDGIVEALLGYGAVFLPAAGLRTGTSVDVSQAGHYWSSTPSGTNDSWNMWFGNSSGGTEGAERCKGYSVRLVQ